MKINNIVLLKRNYLTRGKRGWFNEKTEYKIVTNITKLKLDKYLSELNKNMRVHFWNIENQFNLKSKIGKIEFVTYYLQNKNKILILKEYKPLIDKMVGLLNEV